MISGARALRPAEQTVRLADRHVVYARLATAHQAVVIKLPLLITVGSVPVVGIVVPFVLEADSNTVVMECPELLDQPVAQFARPFPAQEAYDGGTSLEEFRAI